MWQIAYKHDRAAIARILILTITDLIQRDSKQTYLFKLFIGENLGMSRKVMESEVLKTIPRVITLLEE